jgi:hypothetical protein
MAVSNWYATAPRFPPRSEQKIKLTALDSGLPLVLSRSSLCQLTRAPTRLLSPLTLRRSSHRFPLIVTSVSSISEPPPRLQTTWFNSSPFMALHLFPVPRLARTITIAPCRPSALPMIGTSIATLFLLPEA